VPSDGFSHATTLRSFDGRLAFRGAWAFDRSGTLLGVHWQMGGREGVGRCAPPAHCSALLVSTLPPPIPSQPARFVPIISSSPLHTPLQIHTLRASTAAVLCLQHFFRIPTRRHSYILAHSLARSARHQPRTLKRHDIQNLATRRRTSHHQLSSITAANLPSNILRHHQFLRCRPSTHAHWHLSLPQNGSPED